MASAESMAKFPVASIGPGFHPWSLLLFHRMHNKREITGPAGLSPYRQEYSKHTREQSRCVCYGKAGAKVRLNEIVFRAGVSFMVKKIKLLFCSGFLYWIHPQDGAGWA